MYTNGRRRITVYPLGQVGYLFEWDGFRIAIDPYLTDSVADQFGEHLRRQAQPTLPAAALTGVSWILLTHAHLDHTDPESLRGLLRASPDVRFICPSECIPILASCGVSADRIEFAKAGPWQLIGGVAVESIPAAHTTLERDADGGSRYVGYYLRFGDTCLYHAGDTVPHPEIFNALSGKSIDAAFLPVNERNYFRDEAGIVGNMTVREAFEMTARLGARVLVPTHWDLFAPNSTFTWEVTALHGVMKPHFALRFMPCGSVHTL